MPVIFTDLQDLFSKTDTLEKCVDILFIVGLFNHRDHSCGRQFAVIPTTKQKYRKDGFVFRCKHCRRYRSLRTGTVLAEQEITLPNFIALAYLFAVGKLKVCNCPIPDYVRIRT